MCPGFLCVRGADSQVLRNPHEGGRDRPSSIKSSSQRVSIDRDSPGTAPATHGTEHRSTPVSISSTTTPAKRNSSRGFVAPDCGVSPEVAMLPDGEGLEDKVTASPSPANSESGVDEKSRQGDSVATVEAGGNAADAASTEVVVEKPLKAPAAAAGVESTSFERCAIFQVFNLLFRVFCARMSFALAFFRCFTCTIGET